MPHPLVFDCHIKVETMDRRTTPIKVFEAALEDLSMEVDTLQRKFEARIIFYLPFNAMIYHVCRLHSKKSINILNELFFATTSIL